CTPGTPPTRCLPRTTALLARALPRTTPGYLHLDTLRRGGKAILGCQLRAAAHEAGDLHCRERSRPAGCRPTLGAGHEERDLFCSSQVCDGDRQPARRPQPPSADTVASELATVASVRGNAASLFDE